jgi:hypothetical protein
MNISGSLNLREMTSPNPSFSVSYEIAVARPLRQATPDERSEALRADIYAPV